MVTILSATNRMGSMTLKVAEKYLQLANKKGLDAQLIDLENIPVAWADDSIYRKEASQMRDFGHLILNGADRFVIVSPEYNGSIPGILKLMIDSCDPEVFKGKKVALVGVATGRAGNIRGMDHLTDILHYLKAEVYSFKQPVSQVKTLVNANKELIDESTISILSKQLDGFMNF
jgi:NAD(P)H-dependent FMN reductase